MERTKEAATGDVAADLAPGLWPGLATGLREIWDRIGLTMAVSLTWTAIEAAPMALGRALPAAWPVGLRGAVALIGTALVGAPGFAGACYVAHLSAQHEEVDYPAFWRGMRLFFAPAAWLGVINIGVLLLTSLSLWFYARVAAGAGVVCGLVCVYVLLVWAVMAPYQFPVLVAQEAGLFDEEGRRARRGALAAIRRSFYLALGAPIYSLGLFLACVLVVAAPAAAMALRPIIGGRVSGTIVALLPLLGVGALAMLITAPTRRLLVRFGVLPAPPPQHDGGFRL